jgi:hypothetical protein
MQEFACDWCGEVSALECSAEGVKCHCGGTFRPVAEDDEGPAGFSLDDDYSEIFEDDGWCDF